MRFLVLLILALSLAFAAGGGGGGSTLKTFALEQKFSCPGDKLTVTATDPSGPVAGALVEVNKYGSYTVIFSAQTGADGTVVFTMEDEGAYNIKGSKSGYSNAYLLSSIKACQVVPAETFYCAADTTLRARVDCIIDLPDDDILNVRFVPEECRVLDEAGKKKCIETYRVLQTCRIGFEGTNEQRESCIKPKLGIADNVWDQAKACNGDQTCLDDLRQKVFVLAKFRMYNLEYKVREMMESGLDRGMGVDFITYVEESKARFNSAGSISAKKAIITEVQDKWHEFVAQAQADMGVAQ